MSCVSNLIFQRCSDTVNGHKFPSCYKIQILHPNLLSLYQSLILDDINSLNESDLDCCMFLKQSTTVPYVSSCILLIKTYKKIFK